MKVRRLHTITMLATLAITSLLFTNTVPGSAIARSAPFHPGDFVNVNVSFNTYVPLPDVKEQTLVDTQHRGRRFIYRMAIKECAVLKETIAKTCRLTNLNISAQVREHNNRGPIKLYLNGTVQYAITLKEEGFN